MLRIILGLSALALAQSAASDFTTCGTCTGTASSYYSWCHASSSCVSSSLYCSGSYASSPSQCFTSCATCVAADPKNNWCADSQLCNTDSYFGNGCSNAACAMKTCPAAGYSASSGCLATKSYYYLEIGISGITGANLDASSATSFVGPFQSALAAAASTQTRTVVSSSDVTVSMVKDDTASSTLFGSRRLANTIKIYASVFMTGNAAASTGMGTSALNNAILTNLQNSPSASAAIKTALASATVTTAGSIFATSGTSAYHPLSTQFNGGSGGGGGGGGGSFASFLGLENTEQTNAKLAQGVAASLILGVAAAIAVLATACRCPSKGTPDARAKNWHGRANRSTGCLGCGVFAGLVGLVAGFAAPALPWLSYQAMMGLIQMESTTLRTKVTMLGMTVEADTDGSIRNGAFCAYIGLCVLYFPALAMAISAFCRLNALVKHDALPPTAGCLPSFPAIMGLSWMGLVLFAAGLGLEVTGFALARAFFFLPFHYAPRPPPFALQTTTAAPRLKHTTHAHAGSALGLPPAGPAIMYLGFAFAMLCSATLAFSGVGCCCLGPMPGMGVSKTQCCCPERNPDAVPPETKVASTGEAKV